MTTRDQQNGRRERAEKILDAEGVILVRASTITPAPISWLWRYYLARGKFHLIAGAPSTGKTTIALSLAATVSRGGEWPDGQTTPPRDILIWSGEDDPDDTLVPRLIAAGADRNRVHIIVSTDEGEGKRPFDPATDTGLLTTAAQKLGDVGLVIVDPVVMAVAGDSHKNAETRRGLQPLVDLGATLRAAVLGITHVRKGSRGGDPLERVIGSIAFGAVARVVFVTVRSPDSDERLFVRAKSNIGPDGGGYAYTVVTNAIEREIVTSRIDWLRALEGTAADLLGTVEDDDEARTERDDAAAWLAQELADGPVGVKDLQKLAKDAGHSWPTVKRAKDTIAAKAEKAAFSGGWRWSLVEGDHETREEHVTRVGDPLRVDNSKKASNGAASSEGDQVIPLGDPLGQFDPLQDDDHEGDHLGKKGSQEDHQKMRVIPFAETLATTGFEADPNTEGDHLRVSDPLREADLLQDDDLSAGVL